MTYYKQPLKDKNMTHTTSKKQHGITTITISIILLIMMTMAVVFSANVGIMEQKISSNEVRTTEALLSAQAGVDFALSTLSQYDLTTPSSPFVINGNLFTTTNDQAINYNDGSTTKSTGSYSISIDTTLPSYPDELTIVSQGKSSDLSASVTITQKALFASPMRNRIEDNDFILNKAVLIVNGNTDIDSRLINREENPPTTPSIGTTLQVWASGTITNIAPSDPASALFSGSAELTQPFDYVFLNSMRQNADQGLKHISNRTKCAVACNNPSALTNTPNSKMHYLEGNVTLNGLTIGSAEYPVIIIADLTNGDTLQISNTTINGLLLVNGSWDNNNYTATINGAVVVNGGNLTQGEYISINYSEQIYNNLDRVGIYTRSPGSWNDIN